ncbi:MAG: sulfate permease [Stappiaceae bacterium]
MDTKDTIMTHRLDRILPILTWVRTYDRQTLTNDLVAAVIVTIMLIPQSLAYALLAGLPAEAGLYASIVPILLYSVFGTSSVLAVGPVAIVSLMTATTIAEIARQGTMGYATAALSLAFLSGAILLVMGMFRLGFLANFLSHPVIAGFITASGILIAFNQVKHLLGIEAQGHGLVELLGSLVAQLEAFNPATLIIGMSALAFLFWVKMGMKQSLTSIGMSKGLANILTKAGPVMAVAGSTLAVWYFNLAEHAVAIVGPVPQKLPPFTLPSFSMDLISDLALPALLISIIGFVESISVAQTLAAKKAQRIDPDQELIGLGAANIGAAFSGGYPVTGGFARSVVNFDAGAQTPAAGAFTAIGLATAALALTPLIYFLPTATLAATIIVAVLGLIDFSILKRTWVYAKADFLAVVTTIVVTLGFGVEAGVSAGVILSIVLHLYKTSRPHIAEIGLVRGTQHFRNVLRHDVQTDPQTLMLRVDESLYFVNARFLENLLQDRVTNGSDIHTVVLMFSAVNEVDFSALESLEAINQRLKLLGVSLHLSEVKGPVMDRLKRSHLLTHLNGSIHLTNYDAWQCVRKQQALPTAAE